MEVLGTIDIPSSVVLVALILLLLYTYGKYKFSYWHRQGVPGPTPWPFLGNIEYFTNNKETPGEIEDRYCKKYGKVFGVYEAQRKVLIISDPEDIKTILVKDFDKFPYRRPAVGNPEESFNRSLANATGEEWNALRHVMSPTFSTAKIKYMMGSLAKHSNSLADCLVELAKDKKEFYAKKLFGAFSLDVIATTAFRTDINSLKNPDNEFVKMAGSIFKFNTIRILILVLFPWLGSLLRLSAIDPKITAFFKGVVNKIIKMRSEEGKTNPDFLSLLKESTQDGVFEEDKKDTVIEKEPWKENPKKFLTEDLLVAQCVLFFIAGFDTTATTISMAAYNLALNPDCQEKLIEEIDESVQKNGKLTYETVGEMTYLNAVVKETLRLHGIIARLERTAAENYQLGDIYIEKGSLVGIPVYNIHHDPKYYPDPYEFKPERFLNSENEINPYTYLPFGYGRRNCLAMRFALMEVKFAVAACLTKVKFFRSPSTQVPPVFQKKVFLNLPIDLQIGVEKR